MPPTQAARKQRGAWYTPDALISIVLDGVFADFGGASERPVRVLDPSCGDGRFLAAVRDRLHTCGYTAELVGCDVDAQALEAIEDPSVERIHADALSHPWGDARFDIIVGNPPFLSQMSSVTTRGGSSSHGGGPYADAAAEFLALAVRLADPNHGCVGLVLPQSILGSRDASDVRRQAVQLADLTWSWWKPRQQMFDAAVNVCAVGLRRPSSKPTGESEWTRVVTSQLGVPDIDLDQMTWSGRVGDRVHLNANFRDEYYALVPAVTEGGNGPPLVTSGLIDPGVCRWGQRPVTFAKRQWQQPCVDLGQLHGRFARWAQRKLVPKVLVANQTRAIEAVADTHGLWIPGVPVTTLTPHAGVSIDELTAVLTSPVATAMAWHQVAGTGLTTTAIRIRPAALAEVVWPTGSLTAAVAALASGDVVSCGAAVARAYGVDGEALDEMLAWWAGLLPTGPPVVT